MRKIRQFGGAVVESQKIMEGGYYEKPFHSVRDGEYSPVHEQIEFGSKLLPISDSEDVNKRVVFGRGARAFEGSILTRKRLNNAIIV